MTDIAYSWEYKQLQVDIVKQSVKESYNKQIYLEIIYATNKSSIWILWVPIKERALRRKISPP